MVLTALAALLGAHLGITLNNRVWASVAAIGITGFVHALLVLAALGWIDSGGDASRAAVMLSMAGARPLDLYATVVAGGLSALLAGMMVSRGQSRDRATQAKAAFERASLVSAAGQRVDVLLKR